MAAVVVAAMVLAVWAPAGAAAELEASRERLAGAETGLAAAMNRLEQAERELDAAELRLASLTAELAELDEQLALAAHRVARTDADAASSQAQLRRAEAALAEAVGEERTAVDRLEDRVIDVFKRGSTQPQLVLVQAMRAPQDWHGLAVNLRIYERTLAADRDVVDGAAGAVADADRARDGAREARLAADLAADEAEAELRRLVSLRAEQDLLVAEVAAEQQAMRAIYVELDADAEVASLLVQRVSSQVAQLEAREAERAAARDAEREAEREAAGDGDRSDGTDPGADGGRSPVRPPREGDGGAEPDPAPEPPRPEPPGSGSPRPEPPGSEPPDTEPSPPTEPPTTGPSPPPSAGWVTRLPASGQPWASEITAAAQRQGIDPPLLAALVWTESSFNPRVVSHAGAIGLAQLMPGTASYLGVDPWDPAQNLAGGARYLRMMRDRFGSTELALAAYNAGPRRVEEAGPGIPNIRETQLYVVRVQERYLTLLG